MAYVSTAAPRRDNLFGVCAAIGEDFGFDPFWLRIALAVGVIASPVAVLIGYAAAAVIVVLSRVLVRDRRVAARPRLVSATMPVPTVVEEIDAEPLRQAA